MKNNEQIDLWMSRLGQRKSLRVREDLVAEVNAAIVDLETQPFVPWFLQSIAQLGLTTGDAFVALPSDFSIEQENTRPYYVMDGTVFYMTKRIRGAVIGYTTSNTRPIVYGIVGNNFEFRPVADQAYTINFPYYAKTNGGFEDTDVEISNPWLLNAAAWVGWKALTIVARAHLQNQPLAADYYSFERQAKSDIYRHHEAREHQNQDYVVGGISDGS